MLLDFIGHNYFFAFFVSALGTVIAALIAYAHYKRTHRGADVMALLPLLERMRVSGVFDEAATVVEAVAATSTMRPLEDAAVREQAGRTLTYLCGAARVVGSPDAWHAALHGSEYTVVSDLLKDCSVLVWAVRTTPLELEGDARFYNGNKTTAAEEIYTALRVNLHGIRERRWWIAT